MLFYFDRLVEEADYRATAELFGTKGEEKSLDMFIPKSESDFLEYAEMISHRLTPYEVWLRSVSLLSSLGFGEWYLRIIYFVLQKSYHYIALLKAVMRLSVTIMKAEDVKDVASSVTAIANEKLKAEKEAAAGRKKTGVCTDKSLSKLTLDSWSSYFFLYISVHASAYSTIAVYMWLKLVSVDKLFVIIKWVF